MQSHLKAFFGKHAPAPAPLAPPAARPFLQASAAVAILLSLKKGLRVRYALSNERIAEFAQASSCLLQSIHNSRSYQSSISPPLIEFLSPTPPHLSSVLHHSSSNSSPFSHPSKGIHPICMSICPHLSFLNPSYIYESLHSVPTPLKGSAETRKTEERAALTRPSLPGDAPMEGGGGEGVVWVGVLGKRGGEEVYCLFLFLMEFRHRFGNDVSLRKLADCRRRLMMEFHTSVWGMILSLCTKFTSGVSQVKLSYIIHPITTKDICIDNTKNHNK